MREHDGWHGEGFVVNPDDVFVVFGLVDGLISREIEREVSLNAVVVDLSHSGEPVVVGVEGVKSFVVVDDADRAFVCDVRFAVYGYRSRRFKEIFFAVKSISERAVLVLPSGMTPFASGEMRSNEISIENSPHLPFVNPFACAFPLRKSFSILYSLCLVLR